MKVVKVASTRLHVSDADDNDVIYALEDSGYTPNQNEIIVAEPDELAEAAGRLCYKSFNRPNPKTAKNEDYLAHILQVGHYSILEHASVTFFVSGVSRAMLLELERHRFLSFSVVSQRYVDHTNAAFMIPPVLKSLLEEEMESGKTVAETLGDVVTIAHQGYHFLVKHLESNGLSRKEARGAARAVLPEGTETEFFVTGNLRAWRDIISKRNSPYADQEICEFAQEVLSQLKAYAPNTFQDME